MSETERECGANYRQLPLNTRFKKGQSGNPRGRPMNNTAALVAAALNEMARGRPSPRTGSAGRSPKREAVIAQLVNNRPRPIFGTSKKGGAGSEREKPIRSDRHIGGPITPLG
jgi:hypothetical protein